MSRNDILDHPNLRKVWDAIEVSAPEAQWSAVSTAGSTRRPDGMRGGIRVRFRAAVALVLALGMVLFAGNETAGVFAARRALAAQPAVAEEAIQLGVETVEVPEPWMPNELSDLTVNDAGIFARTIAEGRSDQWRLSALGWTSLDLEADLVTSGAAFAERPYLIGRVAVGEPTDTAVIWREENGWQRTFSVAGGALSGLVVADDHLVAVGYRDYRTAAAWISPDGTTWRETELERANRAFVNAGTSDDETGIFVGYHDTSLPFTETRQPAIWMVDPPESVSSVDLPSLDALGFGYSIGGFRLSDGLEDVVFGTQGYVAYTGYLQVWDGFDGLTLRPREAWASLVLLSVDGKEWHPAVLPDLAIYQMVPFGDGYLAAAATPPPSDFESAFAGKVTTEAASAVTNKLYYSNDGLTWQELADSPELGKPLLATTVGGEVVAVDEYAVEDRVSATTTVYVIRRSP